MAGMGNNFTGKINNRDLYSFKKLIDYKIEGSENRLNLINKILEDDSFFREYFDGGNNFYNYSPNNGNIFNKKTALADDINVCKVLDDMGSYLIFGDNKTQQKENHKQKKENNMCSLENLTESHVINYILADNNKKKKGSNKQCSEFTKRQKTIEKEKEEKVMKVEYFRNIYRAIENARSKIEEWKIADELGKELPFDSKELYRYRKMIGELRRDLKEAKHSILKLVEIDAQINPIGVNWEDTEPDFMDIEQVRVFMNNYADLKAKSEDDCQSDLKWIVIDFKNLVDKSELIDREKRVFELKIENDMLGKDVADIISDEFKLENYNESKLMRDLDNISKKISNTAFMVYEDWYYLNIEKGNYKRCKECGEIKLATETYFRKNKLGKYGIKPICKKCMKNR